ncbi:TPA: EAL domain-containing protein [Escherichia coli]|nr:EAL domain-containing protein [Escherichia coli]
MKKNNSVSTDWFIPSLSDGKFEPYIQPIVCASDLSISGGELLMRWHTSIGKVIPPAHFIDRLESSVELLSSVTSNVMSQVVTALSEKKAIQSDNFCLAVNVTSALMENGDFIRMCLRIADESNIRLVLELTERQPFNLTNEKEKVLKKLSDARVKFALDDFGTGYSALSYLQYLPVNYIKIDKIFIQNILQDNTSLHIVENMVNLADKLRISIVAEGVERQEQVGFLQSLGVDYLQGYWFGKPVHLSYFISKYF